MLIFCDFDGTITEVDVTDLLWNDRIPSAVRSRMIAQVNSGRWTMQDYIAHGYGYVTDPPDRILASLRERVRLRAGWDYFLRWIEQSEATLHIISNGLEFYIREFVPKHISVSSFVTDFRGSYRISLPPGMQLPSSTEFKVHCVSQLMAAFHGDISVYIGDGRADFAPSMQCDMVFAVRDSRLARLRKDHLLSVVEFESFATVAETLASACQVASRYDASCASG